MQQIAAFPLESLRNHVSLKRLEGHVKKALSKVWPRRRHHHFAVVVFDPQSGEIGMTVEGSLGDIEDALQGALRTVQQKRSQALALPPVA